MSDLKVELDFRPNELYHQTTSHLTRLGNAFAAFGTPSVQSFILHASAIVQLNDAVSADPTNVRQLVPITAV